MCHNPPQHSHSVTLGIWFTFVLLTDPSWSVWVQTWEEGGGSEIEGTLSENEVGILWWISPLKTLKQDKEYISQFVSMCPSFRLRNKSIPEVLKLFYISKI